MALVLTLKPNSNPDANPHHHPNLGRTPRVGTARRWGVTRGRRRSATCSPPSSGRGGAPPSADLYMSRTRHTPRCGQAGAEHAGSNGARSCPGRHLYSTSLPHLNKCRPVPRRPIHLLGYPTLWAVHTGLGGSAGRPYTGLVFDMVQQTLCRRDARHDARAAEIDREPRALPRLGLGL
jgi:hypothetical protein